MPEKTVKQNWKFRVAFFGTPNFAVPALKALLKMSELTMVTVVTQPDKPVGRKQEIISPPVKKIAEKHQVPVCQPDRIKSVKFEKCVREVDLDVAIVVAYGKIIPQKLLDIPRLGWLNIHGSLLPKYRGAAPIQAAILDGEKETGVTLMKINEGLDTGDIIARKITSIDPTENFESLHDKLASLGADLLVESLLDYLNGKLKPEPQENSIATETAIIKKDDGKINWTKDAEHIERHIRAYNPWPGAFCKHNSKTFKVHSAELLSESIHLSPGKVIYEDGSLIVGCGNGSLKLIKVQLEGKKPQKATQFINGNPDFKEAQLF
ncbi:methionyl-tRNA formyltransferase [Patescibacteria group bacterium]|nr:methionyl-tRNA formyltransferase [Patescibacteria group bacterium]